ncbi:MAG: HD domain-containing protein [Candidatus Gastranaerophilales bacterium]
MAGKMASNGSSKAAAMIAERGVDATLSVVGDLAMIGMLDYDQSLVETIKQNGMGIVVSTVTGINESKRMFAAQRTDFSTTGAKTRSNTDFAPKTRTGNEPSADVKVRADEITSEGGETTDDIMKGVNERRAQLDRGEKPEITETEVADDFATTDSSKLKTKVDLDDTLKLKLGTKLHALYTRINADIDNIKTKEEYIKLKEKIVNGFANFKEEMTNLLNKLHKKAMEIGIKVDEIVNDQKFAYNLKKNKKIPSDRSLGQWNIKELKKIRTNENEQFINRLLDEKTKNSNDYVFYPEDIVKLASVYKEEHDGYIDLLLNRDETSNRYRCSIDDVVSKMKLIYANHDNASFIKEISTPTDGYSRSADEIKEILRVKNNNNEKILLDICNDEQRRYSTKDVLQLINVANKDNKDFLLNLGRESSIEQRGVNKYKVKTYTVDDLISISEIYNKKDEQYIKEILDDNKSYGTRLHRDIPTLVELLRLKSSENEKLLTYLLKKQYYKEQIVNYVNPVNKDFDGALKLISDRDNAYKSGYIDHDYTYFNSLFSNENVDFSQVKLSQIFNLEQYDIEFIDQNYLKGNIPSDQLLLLAKNRTQDNKMEMDQLLARDDIEKDSVGTMYKYFIYMRNNKGDNYLKDYVSEVNKRISLIKNKFDNFNPETLKNILAPCDFANTDMLCLENKALMSLLNGSKENSLTHIDKIFEESKVKHFGRNQVSTESRLQFVADTGEKLSAYDIASILKKAHEVYTDTESGEYYLNFISKISNNERFNADDILKINCSSAVHNNETRLQLYEYFKNELNTADDKTKNTIVEILSSANGNCEELVIKLWNKKEFPKEAISKVANNYFKNNKKLLETLCNEPNYPIGHIDKIGQSSSNASEAEINTKLKIYEHFREKFKFCDDREKYGISSIIAGANEGFENLAIELTEKFPESHYYITEIGERYKTFNKEFITEMIKDSYLTPYGISNIVANGNSSEMVSTKNNIYHDFKETLCLANSDERSMISNIIGSSRNGFEIHAKKLWDENIENRVFIQDIGYNYHSESKNVVDMMISEKDFPRKDIGKIANYYRIHEKQHLTDIMLSKKDFPRKYILECLEYLNIDENSNLDLILNKLKFILNSGIDAKLGCEIVSNAKVISFFNDDVIGIIKDLKNKNADVASFIKTITDFEIPATISEKIDRLTILSSLEEKHIEILKKQGVDIEKTMDLLMRSIDAKSPTISTTRENMNEFLTRIGNSEKTDGAIQNADFAQFGKDGIKLQYSREEFAQNMNALIKKYQGTRSSANINDVEIPKLELTQEDIELTKQKIEELKSRHQTESVEVIIDGKTVQGTRFMDTQGGSNTAYFTQIEDKLYYIKYPNAAELGQSIEEVMASQLYRAAEIDAPNLEFVYDKEGGIIGMASEYVPNISKQASSNSEIYEGFAADCWLANWDASKNGNTEYKNGKPVKVDVGGSLNYRARGGLKADFNSIVNELASIIENNSIYMNMNKADLLNSLKHVTEMPEARIHKIISESPSDDINLADKLIKRKEYMTIFAQKIESLDEADFDGILPMITKARQMTNEEFIDTPNIAEQLGYVQTKTGFEGMLNTRNLDELHLNSQQRAVAEKMVKEIEKFTLGNRVADGVNLSQEAKDFLNSILKGVPEFAPFFGKSQHSAHDYSLDVHILKVLQDSMNDPLYSKLGDKDRLVLKMSTLLHDIGKRHLEGGSDTGHAQLSAEWAYSILERFNFDDSMNERIVNAIQNHHWFKEYNQGSVDAQTIATLTRRPEDFLIYQIMAKADLKNVNDGFYQSRLGASSVVEADAKFAEKMAEIKKEVDVLGEKQVVITASKFLERPGGVKKDGTVVAPRQFPKEKITINGEETEIGVLDLANIDPATNMQQFGFANITADDLRLNVHMVDNVKQMQIFKTLTSNPMNYSAQSISMVSLKDKATYSSRLIGLVVELDNANVSQAHFSNTGSGFEKGLNRFTKLMFETGKYEKYHDYRAFVKNEFITYMKEQKGIELDERTYSKLAKYISQVKNPETQMRSVKIGDTIYKKEDLLEAFTYSRDMLTEAKGSSINQSHNEIVAMSPKVKAVIVKVSSIDQVPQDVLQFAKDNNLNIVLLGQ